MKAGLVFAAMLALALPAHADMQVQPGAPKGFEALEAPRPTVVTLHYGGEVLGLVPAHFSPGRIGFDNPAAIVEKIPAITDKARIAAVLAQPLETHPDRLCTLKRSENCGTLTPDIAGVIFDEDMLAAELFINPAYLAVTDQNTAHYLPLPAPRFFPPLRGLPARSTAPTARRPIIRWAMPRYFRWARPRSTQKTRRSKTGCASTWRMPASTAMAGTRGAGYSAAIRCSC